MRGLSKKQSQIHPSCHSCENRNPSDWWGTYGTSMPPPTPPNLCESVKPVAKHQFEKAKRAPSEAGAIQQV
jgi:hypothetical protein